MPDAKISQLPALSDLHVDDELVVHDVSEPNAAGSKKATVATLMGLLQRNESILNHVAINGNQDGGAFRVEPGDAGFIAVGTDLGGLDWQSIQITVRRSVRQDGEDAVEAGPLEILTITPSTPANVDSQGVDSTGATETIAGVLAYDTNADSVLYSLLAGTSGARVDPFYEIISVQTVRHVPDGITRILHQISVADNFRVTEGQSGSLDVGQTLAGTDFQQLRVTVRRSARTPGEGVLHARDPEIISLLPDAEQTLQLQWIAESAPVSLSAPLELSVTDTQQRFTGPSERTYTINLPGPGTSYTALGIVVELSDYYISGTAPGLRFSQGNVALNPGESRAVDFEYFAAAPGSPAFVPATIQFTLALNAAGTQLTVTLPATPADLASPAPSPAIDGQGIMRVVSILGQYTGVQAGATQTTEATLEYDPSNTALDYAVPAVTDEFSGPFLEILAVEAVREIAAVGQADINGLLSDARLENNVLSFAVRGSTTRLTIALTAEMIAALLNGTSSIGRTALSTDILEALAAVYNHHLESTRIALPNPNTGSVHRVNHGETYLVPLGATDWQYVIVRMRFTEINQLGEPAGYGSSDSYYFVPTQIREFQITYRGSDGQSHVVRPEVRFDSANDQIRIHLPAGEHVDSAHPPSIEVDAIFGLADASGPVAGLTTQDVQMLIDASLSDLDPAAVLVPADDVGGTGDEITLSNVPLDTTRVIFFARASNTTRPELRLHMDPDTGDRHEIRRRDGSALAAGDIATGRLVKLVLNAEDEDWISDILPPASGGGSGLAFANFRESVRLYYTHSPEDTEPGLPNLSGATYTEHDTPLVNNISFPRTGGVWYRDRDQSTGPGVLWAIHLTTATDGTSKAVYAGAPAEYFDPKTKVVLYEDQELTEDEQNTAQRNIGGPFVINSPPPGGQFAGGDTGTEEDANARWASEFPILFTFGTQIAIVLGNEVPGSGAVVQTNIRNGAALDLPIYQPGHTLWFGTGRSFVTNLGPLPPVVYLACRIEFLSDGPAFPGNEVLMDGLINLRRIGNEIYMFGDDDTLPATAGGLINHRRLTTEASGLTEITLLIEMVRQPDGGYGAWGWADRAGLRDSAISRTEASLNAISSDLAVGSTLRRPLETNQVETNMGMWDLVIWVPPLSSRTLVDGVNNRFTLAERNAILQSTAGRDNPYGLITRVETDFDDTGLPHGSQHRSALASDLAPGAVSPEITIPLLNTRGEKPDRVKVALSGIVSSDDVTTATEIGLEYLIGSNSYFLGSSDQAVRQFRPAHYDGDDLRLKLRNVSTSRTYSEVITDVLGFDHRDRGVTNFEIFAALPHGATPSAAGQVFPFAGGRAIPVEDILGGYVWGSPGHGSVILPLLPALDGARVLEVGADITDISGHFWVAGWQVNSPQSTGMFHYHASARPSTVYSIFGFRRLSTEPEGFVSRLEFVESGNGSPRHLFRMMLYLRV